MRVTRVIAGSDGKNAAGFNRAASAGELQRFGQLLGLPADVFRFVPPPGLDGRHPLWPSWSSQAALEMPETLQRIASYVEIPVFRQPQAIGFGEGGIGLEKSGGDGASDQGCQIVRAFRLLEESTGRGSVGAQ